MKKIFSSIICLILVFGISSGLSINVSAAEIVTVRHSLPSKIKIGQSLNKISDCKVYFQNLIPNEEVFLSLNGSDWGMNGTGDDYKGYYVEHRGSGGTQTIDNKGIAIADHLMGRDNVYKPGTMIIQPAYCYPGENWISVGSPIKITIEEPIIKTNAPSSVKTGTTISLTTELTNTALTNKKVSVYNSVTKNNPGEFMHVVAYKPYVEIIEGKDIVKQSSQDYSNTLNTRETLTFNKPGTVKIKVKYNQINTCSECIPDDGKLYNPEKLIIINVTSDTATPPSNNTSAPTNSLPSNSNNTLTPSSTPNSSSSILKPTEETPTSTVNEQPITIANEDTGVKIVANNGVVPDGTIIIANMVIDGEPYNKVKDALKDIADKFSVFDLSLENDNAKIQPSGKVKVSIPIPSDYDKSRLAIYYINDDVEKVELTSTIDGDTIIFETEHFGTYVIAEKITAIDANANNQTPKSNSPIHWIILSIGLILMIGTGVAVWFLKFKKKPSEK